MKMSDKVLLVIDMLNDFIRDNAPLYVPGSQRIIAPIAKQIDRARHDRVPILYLCDSHEPDDPELKVWPNHAMKGSPGSEVIAELAPVPTDVIIPKKYYSAFFKTDLEPRLRTLRVGKILLTGVCTEICVLYTAVDAIMRGIRVEVPDGCTAGLTREGHEFALKQIRDVLQPHGE